MDSQRPVVSVITANYNGAKYLVAAIRSVLDQSLTSFEMIIVDDRSNDDSLAVIERAAAGDPRVRVLVQELNGGPGAARNRALDAACGEWIAVFDSDDLMEPQRLERMVAVGVADKADIVVDNLAVFTDGESGSTPLLPPAAFSQPQWITLADYIGSARMYARHPSFGYLKPLIRARALADARYRPDLRIGEDYDLVLRLLIAGGSLRFEPAALYRYRKHASSISHVMHRRHVEQMLAADMSLDKLMAGQSQEARRASAARRRSLHAALEYDAVVARLKARDIRGGLLAGLASPRVWPLLTMPVVARLRRAMARLRRNARQAA